MLISKEKNQDAVIFGITQPMRIQCTDEFRQKLTKTSFALFAETKISTDISRNCIYIEWCSMGWPPNSAKKFTNNFVPQKVLNHLS